MGSLLLLAWIGSGSAFAEDSTFAGAAAPPAEPKAETHVTGELGGTWATGNSNYYAVNGAINASHQVKKDKLSFTAGMNLGAARAVLDENLDGIPEGFAPKYTENARKLFVDGRYDRFLSEKDSLYVLAGAFHDKFAGYDLRAHEQVGYSRLLVKNESTELKTELGVDLAEEDYFENPDPNYQTVLAARVLAGLSHKFNESVSLSDTVEVYENFLDFEDVRILNTAALTSALTGKLSVKLSHALIFDNVPVEGFRSLDQTTMVTLVVTLL